MISKTPQIKPQQKVIIGNVDINYENAETFFLIGSASNKFDALAAVDSNGNLSIANLSSQTIENLYYKGSFVLNTLKQ